ncbi:MAG: diguanylate cyclase domain-containing protein [Rhodopila sp.]
MLFTKPGLPAIRKPHGLLLVGISVAAGFLALTAWQLIETRRDARDRAVQNLTNLTLALERDLARNIEFCDQSLQGTLRALSIPGMTTLDPDVRQLALFDQSIRASYLGDMMVIGPSGDRLYESAAAVPGPDNVARRDYFQIHRDHADAGLYISRPYRRTHGGDWAIAFSRRIPTADGSFAGIVAGVLKLAYFSDAATKLNLGGQGSVALIRADGILIARHPWNDADMGRDLASGPLIEHANRSDAGSYQAISRIDGIERLYAFHKVGDYPLVLAASLSTRTVYAEWWHRTLTTGAVFLVLTGILAVVLEIFRREFRRRLQAELAARRAEQAARTVKAKYSVLAENSSDIIACYRLDGIWTYVSPSVTRTLGFTPGELVGRPWAICIHPEDVAAADAVLVQLRGGADRVSFVYRAPRKYGGFVWLEAHLSLVRHPSTQEAEEVVAVIRDISRRKRQEDELSATLQSLVIEAGTDALTGLANRRRFDAVVEQAWASAQQTRQPLSILMIDADCFKLYNDQYGHPAGDEALRAIARCIQQCLRRPGDIGARYGGEEFAVVLPATDADGALCVAQAVREAVGACAIAHDLAPMGHVTVSIGVATAASGGDPAALVARADQALYQAKGGGRNCVVHAEAALFRHGQDAPEAGGLLKPMMPASTNANRDCGEPRCIDACYDGSRRHTPSLEQAEPVLKVS